MLGRFSSCYLLGLFVMLQCHFPLFTHRHFYRLLFWRQSQNRRLAKRRRQNEPKTFWLGEHNNTNWSLLRRSVCRHQFQILIYIHNVTLRIISFSFLNPWKKIFFFCINAKCRRNQDTTWVAEQRFSHFKWYHAYLLIRSVNWDESTQAYDLLHSEVKLNRSPNLFRFNAVRKRRVVRQDPLDYFHRCFNAVCFGERTQSNWIIINYNNKTIFPWKMNKKRREQMKFERLFPFRRLLSFRFRPIISDACSLWKLNDGGVSFCVLLLPPHCHCCDRVLSAWRPSHHVCFEHFDGTNQHNEWKKWNDVVCFGCVVIE